MPRKLRQAGLPGKRSPCPLSSALDLVGDKWTLLIVRDMLYLDKRRFSEFLDGPERITTNILADRLRKLQRYGLVRARRYQDNPPRDEYLLTAAGAALADVLIAVARWGVDHIPGTAMPTEADRDTYRARRG